MSGLTIKCIKNAFSTTTPSKILRSTLIIKAAEELSPDDNF